MEFTLFKRARLTHFKSTVSKIVLIILFLITQGANAGVIEHYAGVDISGTSDGPYLDHNIGMFEIRLLDAVSTTYDRNATEDFSVKIERDFFNLQTDNYRDQDFIIQGEFNSNIAASFINENSRDDFAQRVEEKDSFDSLTQAMLIGSLALRRIDIEVEREDEQGRPDDAEFYQQLFDDEAYSTYSLDLSFDFITDWGADLSVINIALYDSLYSFYTDSNLAGSLSAVEHDMSVSLDSQSSPALVGSVERRLWFDNEIDAINAQSFFANDIDDPYSSQSHSGWLAENLFSNKLVRFKRDFTFSNVEMGISQVIDQEPVDVPEPATFGLLLLSLAFLFRHKAYH